VAKYEDSFRVRRVSVIAGGISGLMTFVMLIRWSERRCVRVYHQWWRGTLWRITVQPVADEILGQVLDTRGDLAGEGFVHKQDHLAAVSIGRALSPHRDHAPRGNTRIPPNPHGKRDTHKRCPATRRRIRVSFAGARA